ncbi:M50 family metallopeptidase [Mesobacillus foraminis]|uniref:M50 family metallopeptidase n=1 Tax=Mesobacillus foraminis TaxID=279826 RepID=UPI001BE64697|nr:M50 family metallopeptidase [Mesobacillus foraminis]MBT2759058.1 M50 family metallopeptidase [Mesobacillus foraminis]
MLVTSLMICTWLAITLHELGHFLFGKWCGDDFIFLAFGPFLIEKKSAGIRVKENRNWLFFGGVALMTPPQEKREILVKKMTLYTAGGPFISLLLAIFGLGLYELFSYQMLFYFALMNGTMEDLLVSKELLSSKHPLQYTIGKGKASYG